MTAPARIVDLLLRRTLTLAEYWLVLKATLVLGEIVFVFASERLARTLGVTRSRTLAIFLYLLPCTWSGGAWFGQIDMFGTALLLVAARDGVLFHRDGRTRNLAVALVALVAAVLTKQLTWFAVPMLFALLFARLVTSGTRAQWALALSSPALLFAFDPFLILPATFRSHVWFVAQQGALHNELVIASGASLWALVARGGTPTYELVWFGFDSRVWGWSAFAVAAIAIVFCVMRRPEARTFVLAAGLSEWAMATLLTGVHERYLTHAIPLLLIVLACKPKRASFVLGLFVAFGAGVFVLSTLHASLPQALGRPEPIALLSFAWGIGILVAHLRAEARPTPQAGRALRAQAGDEMATYPRLESA